MYERPPGGPLIESFSTLTSIQALFAIFLHRAQVLLKNVFLLFRLSFHGQLGLQKLFLIFDDH